MIDVQNEAYLHFTSDVFQWARFRNEQQKIDVRSLHEKENNNNNNNNNNNDNNNNNNNNNNDKKKLM